MIINGSNVGALNESKLALVNAVYFNGDWQNTFDEAETRAEPFYLGRVDVKVDVDMMHQNGRFNTGNIDVLDARILELPYLVIHVVAIHRNTVKWKCFKRPSKILLALFRHKDTAATDFVSIYSMRLLSENLHAYIY